MIDLHSHVLPGIDDGPPELVDSLAMARVAVLAGTRVLVATPHVRADHPKVVPAEIAGRVADLNAELENRSIGLEVVPGGEVALVDALERDVEELRAVTLGGNGQDLLVETPHGPLPSGFEALVDGVRRRGFRVLLAHPEINPDLQQRPERLGAMADAGVLIQVTAGSLAAGGRSRRGKLALRAVAEGWVHAIASDGHRAGRRPPSVSEGLRAAAEAIPGSEAALEWLTVAAPLAILSGEELPPRPPVAARRRRSLWRR